MGLKLKVEKLEDVPEAQRSLYTEIEGGGGFHLGVDDLPDVGPALRAKDHEVAEHAKTKAELKRIKDANTAAEERARKAAEEAAAKGGDVEALRKSHETTLAKANTDWQAKYDGDVGSLTTDVNRLLIDNVATTLASQIALEGSAAVLIPHISSRLGVELRDGKRVTVVKDAEGKPSALTIDDLKKEIVSNKAFAPLIVGSKGSGSGAGGAKGGGAAGAKSIPRAAFDAMNPAEKAAFARVKGNTVTD